MMSASEFQCHLEHIDPRQNMQRFYHLSLTPSLFPTHVALVREWGRLGRPGRLAISLHADEADARKTYLRWQRAKLRKGYVRKDWMPNH